MSGIRRLPPKAGRCTSYASRGIRPTVRGLPVGGGDPGPRRRHRSPDRVHMPSRRVLASVPAPAPAPVPRPGSECRQAVARSRRADGRNGPGCPLVNWEHDSEPLGPVPRGTGPGAFRAPDGERFPP